MILLAVLGFIGALIWWFGKRRAVLDAAGQVVPYGAVTPTAPHVPAGWYAEPDGVNLRWWDGVRWSEHRQPAAPPEQVSPS